MEVERITQALAEKTKPRASADVWIRERGLRGFGLRIYPSGKRSYVLTYYVGGVREKAVIGEHGAPWKPHPVTGAARILTAELAREEAIRLMGSQLEGKDPRAARDAFHAVPTLEAFAEKYLADWSAIEKAPRSLIEDRGLVTRHLVPWAGRSRMTDIGPGQVTRLKVGLKKHPVTFNRCRALLSHMFGRAYAWGDVPRSHPNPCLDVPKYEERGRERPLRIEELPAVGAALTVEEAAAPVAVAVLRAIMFTGARPVELLPLLRSELPVALKTGVLVRPSLKAGRRRARTRPVYLNEFAAAVLEGVPPTPGNPHVFPGAGRKPLSIYTLEASWERVQKYVAGWTLARRRWRPPTEPAAVNVDDVNVYDLRHTYGTLAGELLEHPKHVQDLLGHSDFRTTQRYIHLSADPLRAASGRVAGAIARAMKGKA